MGKILFEGEEIKTVGDVFTYVGGILYLINKNGKEIDDYISMDAKVLAVKHIGNNECDTLTDTYYEKYNIIVDMQ